MAIKIVALLSVGAFLVGCARNSDGIKTDSVEPYSVQQDVNLSLKEKGLSGSGKVIFQRPLLGSNSRENYTLGFRFLDLESSKIILHSHFSGFSLEDGVKVEIFPQEEKLWMKISTPGYPASRSFQLMDPIKDHEIQLKIEIHDGSASGVHILVWNDLVTHQGEVQKKQDRIFLGNHIFNSEEEGLSFLSHGAGMFWGLELINTELSTSHRQAGFVE